MIKDPVCNMDIEGGKSELQVSHNDKTYDFCSDNCKQKFEKDPSAYVKNEGHDHGSHGCC